MAIQHLDPLFWLHHAVSSMPLGRMLLVDHFLQSTSIRSGATGRIGVPKTLVPLAVDLLGAMAPRKAALSILAEGPQTSA